MRGYRRGVGRSPLAFAAGVVLGLLCAFAHAVSAQEARAFEQMLPQDTLVYLSIRNPSQDASFRLSAMGKIAEEPEMKAFLDHVEHELERLHQQYASQLPVDLGVVQKLLRHELSFAFTGVRVLEEGPEVPGVVISSVLDVPPAEAEQVVLDALGALFGVKLAPAEAFDHGGAAVKSVALPGGPPIYYMFLGNRAILASTDADLRAAVDLARGTAPSLADAPAFKKVMAETGGRGATLSAYVNSELVFNLLKVVLTPQQSGVLRSLGLYDIKAIGLSSRFADGGIVDSLYLYAPGQRTGLLPPAGRPVDLSLLDWVPRNATAMSLFRLDARHLYAVILSSIEQMDPDQHRELLAEVADLEQQAGFSIPDDLLASLGDQVMWSLAPRESILVVEVNDRDGFDSCMQSVAGALGAENVELNRMEYGGATIHHLDVRGFPVVFSPSYAYYGQFAVFGLLPQSLKRFLARMERGGPSIRDSEDFRRVAGGFLDGCDAVSYQDVRSGLADFYNLLVIGAQALHGVREVSIRAELMPHPSLVEPHLFGLGVGTINDAEGILCRSFSPVGSAGGLLNSMGQIGRLYGGGSSSVFTLATLSAMLMPALVRSRGEARKVVSINNLRQLGMAIAMYQNDHGELPETLQDLLPYLGSSEVLVAPGDPHPVTLGEGVKSSYHYVGRLAPGQNPMVIIAYERRDIRLGGRSSLFLDCHVELIQDGSSFRRRLQESLRMVQEKGWEGYTPEHRAAIEAFYADRLQQ